jgi:ABC-type Mn2+/Zn2+ transport system ATPase subunit
MKIKAGYRTSEFWFTLVSFIFSGLYLTGILTENDQKEELITVVSHAVESCILIGGQLFVLYRYVKGRQEVKKIVEQENLELVKKQEEKTNEPKRTTKAKTRKPSTRKPKGTKRS